MQVNVEQITNTSKKIIISANSADLSLIKNRVLKSLSGSVKAPGFREGKVPANIVEKYVDQQRLQTEFVDQAVNELYIQAARQEKIRPLDQPKVSIKKFVPFSTLEFEAEVTVLPPIKLADYKKIKKTVKPISVADKDVEEVLNNLATRQSEKKEVKREAKNTDQVWIDFKGFDKEKAPVPGAEGKDYPLVLGSKTFIPGFEEKLIGKKPGENTEFTIKFPKDYGVEKLSGAQVTFEVKVNKVEEVKKPKMDDDFASKVGPFKNLAELKKDIKAQLKEQKEKQAKQDLEAEIVKEITDKSSVEVPEALISDQAERIITEIKRDLTYRGLTYQEFLKREGKTEEEFKKTVVNPDAEQRVKAGLVLAEIAEKEKITVTPEELQIRIQALKAQYPDQQMQQQLDSEEARRDLSSRLMTEKTIKAVYDSATK